MHVQRDITAQAELLVKPLNILSFIIIHVITLTFLSTHLRRADLTDRPISGGLWTRAAVSPLTVIHFRFRRMSCLVRSTPFPSPMTFDDPTHQSSIAGGGVGFRRLGADMDMTSSPVVPSVYSQ